MASKYKIGDLIRYTYRPYVFSPGNYTTRLYRANKNIDLMNILNGATAEVVKAGTEKLSVKFVVKDHYGNTVEQTHPVWSEEVELVFVS
jgi:hypothetical protein